MVVLDGDEGFRTALATNLRDDGHPVIECSAVDVSGTNPDGDALVAVVHQGRNDALAFARAFRRAHPEAALVIVTTTWSQRIESARKLGTVLMQPVDYETLHALIHAGN